MCIVLVGAVVFSYIAFCEGEAINGLGFILTALIPVLIWFSDGQDNKKRDNILQNLKQRWKAMGLKSLIILNGFGLLLILKIRYCLELDMMVQLIGPLAYQGR